MLSQQADPPAAAATLKAKMAYKLQTEKGKAFYRLRKCTVEPIIGIIKETMGFCQFSLRGLTKAAGEWNLVCLAYNFRRLHGLMGLKGVSPTGC
jgi:Transposase DDE domain